MLRDASQRKARVVAFYLPQYHPTPENDGWWGKGFTEWTNVAKARPLFPGHSQPFLPSELGFYDLRLPVVREAQADLARAHGIEAFCYWHYWFAGRRLLERPFSEVLASGQPDFPFCLAWANETWTGIWHGAGEHILIEQTYPGIDDYEAHFDVLLPAFRDRRYFRVDGKPLFFVLRPERIPNPVEFTDCWRHLAASAGLPGIYFVGNSPNFRDWQPSGQGFDAHIPRAPGGLLQATLDRHPLRRAWYSLRTWLQRKGWWPNTVSYRWLEKPSPEVFDLFLDRYPCVMPNWDNTPRSRRRGWMLVGATPEQFRLHLRAAIIAVAPRQPDHRIVFVKSWNEWAEGNCLEPSWTWGRAYLHALRDEVFENGSLTSVSASSAMVVSGRP